jgi:protein subunit release factor A
MDAERPEGILHAWLAAGDDDAQFFLEDILRLLRTRALREGITVLEANSAVSSPVPAIHVYLGIAGQLLARLADEVGLHRAQFVAPTSTTGRVQTAIVAVEFLKDGLPATTGRPGWQVVKTYNYVLQSCVRHATGQVSPLHEALLGQV